MTAFKSMVADNDENEDGELDSVNTSRLRESVSSQQTKIPSLSRSTRKPSVLTSPLARGRSRDPEKKVDSLSSNRFGFSSGKQQEVRKVSELGESESVRRSRSKSSAAVNRKDPSSAAVTSPRMTQTSETTAHSELSLLKAQMQQLQENDGGGLQQEQNHQKLKKPMQTTATVFKLPLASKVQQVVNKNSDASVVAAAKAQTVAKARVDSYKKAGKAGKTVISLLRNRFVGSSVSISSASSTASDDLSSPAHHASMGPISVDTISSIPSLEDNSPQRSGPGFTTSSFLSTIESSPTTTVRVADGGILTVTSSGPLYAQHVIESPDRSNAVFEHSHQQSKLSQDDDDDDGNEDEGMVSSSAIPSALREMLDRLAKSSTT